MDEMEFVENTNCPIDSCNRTAVQNFLLTTPLEVRPVVSIGDIDTTCISAPLINCEQVNDGRACVLTVVQEIRVSIPLECGAEVRKDDSTIACGESDDDDDDDDTADCVR